MKASELKEMSIEELNKELFALRREAFNLRMQKATDQLTRPHLVRVARRNIARVKTILQEKEQAEKKV